MRDIAVRGGVLRVGEWAPTENSGIDPGSAPVVLALHGLDGAHLAWSWLAEQLPGARVIAPDLRGRGRSADLPGPFGIAEHLADLLCVMDALHLTEVTVVGHSLGAFIAVALAAARPGCCTQMVLVDGGLPLTVPLALHPDDLVELVCGRQASRVEFAFDSLESHCRFWRLHPAFAKDWSSLSAAYADYLVDHVAAVDGGVEFRPIASRAAVEADAREVSGSIRILQRLRDADCPITLLTATRDLSNASPGIYTARELALTLPDDGRVRTVAVDAVNHYSIVMSERGASAVAQEICRGWADPGVVSALTLEGSRSTSRSGRRARR